MITQEQKVELIKGLIREADTLYYNLYKLYEIKGKKHNEEDENLLYDLLDSLECSAARVKEVI